MLELESVSTKLENLCRRYKVKRLYLFGSALTERFDEKTSDVDVLVEMLPMPPLRKGEYLIRLWDELEGLFEHKVDLLTPESLRNPYLIREIERTKSLIYDSQGAEISV